MKKNSNSGFKLSFDLVMEIILLVIIFLIPVIFDRRLGIVFSGTKVAWLRAFVIVALGVWAVKILIAGEHRFRRTVLDWPVLTFLLATTVATMTSVHVYTSFAGFYGRFEGLSTWYLFGLLFFITTNYIRSFDQLKRIIIAVVSAATMMSIYGVIQRQELDPYMWGGVVTWQRVIGTIGQPNFLAAYILMAFFLGLVLFLEEKKTPGAIDWFEQLLPLGCFLFAQAAFVIMLFTLEAQDVLVWYLGFGLITAAVIIFAYSFESPAIIGKLHPLCREVLLGICLLLIYICLLYTQSRGGYLGFFTGAVLFCLVVGRQWLFKNWKKLALLSFLIVVISGITMSRPEYSPFERFASEITTREKEEMPGKVKSELELKGAAGSRTETWKSAFKIIADYPLFGIGPEDLKMVFPRYETELFRFKEAFHVKQDRCHNETFDVPVTKGLIAFFLYLWILFTVFKTGFIKLKTASDSQRLMLGGLLAAILAYLVQNQFSFGVVAITSLFWIMWGMVMVLGEEGRGTKDEGRGTKDEGRGRRDEGRGMRDEGRRTRDEGRMFSWQEIPWLPVAGVVLVGFLLIYLSFLSFRGDIYYKSGKTLLEMRRLPEAAEELKKSLSVFPFEGTTVSHLGIAYLNMGNIEEAVKYLNYGTRIDPYNADNFYMLSRIYLSLYDQGRKEALKDAVANVEIALKIDPYYAEAYDTLGQIYERQGKMAEAAKMYRKAFEVNPTLPDTMGRFVNTFLKFGWKDEARKLLEEAANKFPDNIEIFKAKERLK